MKISTVYDRSGERAMLDRDGDPVAFPTFHWYHMDTSPSGWTLHVFAVCVATTEDFRFQMFRGFLALGWHGGPLIEISPGIKVYQIYINLKGGLLALYRHLTDG
jgi:hypothetical protein